jgi:dipeptidyl-peptidase-3
VALTQLHSILKGDTIEEDHQRDRQLIANYVMDKTGAIAKVERDGKTYMTVRDYDKMHAGVGMLLAELMRIKGEGDYNAIKALVGQYGVHFDPALRDQVVARYKKLDLPIYWAGINTDYDKICAERRGGFGRHLLSARLREAATGVRVHVRKAVAK